MKLAIAVFISAMAFSSVTYAQTPCDILAEGNKFYKNGVWDQDSAIQAYEKINQIEPDGRQECSASVYASLGSMYAEKAEKMVSANDFKKSTDFYRTSSR